MSPHRLRILLIGSLTLNVFLLGGIGGGALMWLRTDQASPSTASPPSPRGLRLVGASLSPEHRQPFRRALRETRRASAALVDESRAGRAEAARLLARPTVDQAAVNAALARARTADLALRARLEERAVAFAATLPQAERGALAEGLARRRAARQAGN